MGHGTRWARSPREGRRGAEGEDAARGARGDAGDGAARLDAARLRGRVGADLGEAGRHRRRRRAGREHGRGAAGAGAGAGQPRVARANEVLKRAASFCGGGARLPLPEAVAFTDANKGDAMDGRRLGAGLIRRLLRVAPSSYRAAKTRASRPVVGSVPRRGARVVTDQTARPMRVAGIEGARRSKRVKTTRPDPVSARRHRAAAGVRRDGAGQAPGHGSVGRRHGQLDAERGQPRDARESDQVADVVFPVTPGRPPWWGSSPIRW